MEDKNKRVQTTLNLTKKQLEEIKEFVKTSTFSSKSALMVHATYEYMKRNK